MDEKITELQPDALKEIIAETKEKEYTIVDVREKFEYNESHIPGAQLITLSDIVKDPDLVPDSKEVIFYCHSGSRSMAAAQLFAESEKGEKAFSIKNLANGMMGWDGAALEDIPKIDLFRGKDTLEELILRAMELEKGAFLFYSEIYKRYDNLPYADTIKMLSKAETAHARTLFRSLGKPMDQFDKYFDSLKGDILESGISTTEALDKIESISGNLCIGLLEFLVLMEVSAYDLYKVMSGKTREAKETFLTIAQEEKAHMRSIASSFVLCS